MPVPLFNWRGIELFLGENYLGELDGEEWVPSVYLLEQPPYFQLQVDEWQREYRP
jgi:hypothetical protein